MHAEPSLGQLAYEAHARRLEQAQVSTPVPDWDELPLELREAWEAGAEAAGSTAIARAARATGQLISALFGGSRRAAPPPVLPLPPATRASRKPPRRRVSG